MSSVQIQNGNSTLKLWLCVWANDITITVSGLCVSVCACMCMCVYIAQLDHEYAYHCFIVKRITVSMLWKLQNAYE